MLKTDSVSRRSGREQPSRLEDFVSDGGTLASSLFSGSPTMRSINLNLQNRDITTNKILRASLTFKGSPLSQICISRLSKDGMNCGAYFPRFCSEHKILDPVLSAWGFLLASTGSVDRYISFLISLRSEF